jgi:hypothetical protein
VKSPISLRSPHMPLIKGRGMSIKDFTGW